MRWIVLAVVFSLLAGCGSAIERSALRSKLGDAPYKIGPVGVLVRKQSEVKSICDTIGPSNTEEIRGCYVPERKEMVLVADTKVALLLFKHYLEGGADLVHGVGGDFSRLGKDPYRIGPFEVWVRGKREVHFLCSVMSGKPELLKLGCWIKGEKGTILGAQEVILVIDEPFVLLHEIKHHFEGAWHK